MKGKRAGSRQSRQNFHRATPAPKIQRDNALELIASYRSFPPVGPYTAPVVGTPQVNCSGTDGLVSARRFARPVGFRVPQWE